MQKRTPHVLHVSYQTALFDVLPGTGQKDEERQLTFLKPNFR